MFRISGKNFKASGFMQNGIVTRTSMLIEYMEGWSIGQVKRYCRNEGWQIVFVL